MAGRRLDPDEAALWARVKASVRPLHSAARRPLPAAPPAEKPPGRVTPSIALAPSRGPLPAGVGERGNTLDGGWDRRLSRGSVMPDSMLDLHGHNLRSAHALLDGGIERAVARGDRVMLVITGKPPRAGSERPHARGAIRSQIADWLVHSRHHNSIAAVRNAHPRHGGPGALYLVFRRPKSRP